MRAKEWAQRTGVTLQTVQRWCNAGKMPCPVEKIGKVWIIHDPRFEDGTFEKEMKKEIVCYARVSSSDQKEDLVRQADRLKAFAINAGYKNARVVKEVGSGMNEDRKILTNLLKNKNIGTIIVEHRERLSRINFKLIEAALNADNREIIVVDDTEVKDDIVRDIIEVMTSFCAKLYGRRSAKNRAEAALKAAENEVVE